MLILVMIYLKYTLLDVSQVCTPLPSYRQGSVCDGDVSENQPSSVLTHQRQEKEQNFPVKLIYKSNILS